VKFGAVSANKWLGYIARDEGDLAGANQFFTTYLSTNPTDAARIRSVMDGG